MEKKLEFDSFLYFLDCYFVQTFLFDDLERLTYKFRYRESEEETAKLLQELNALKELNNWDYVKNIAKEKAQFLLSDIKMNDEMIETMIRCLTDSNWDAKTYKPFS